MVHLRNWFNFQNFSNMNQQETEDFLAPRQYCYTLQSMPRNGDLTLILPVLFFFLPFILVCIINMKIANGPFNKFLKTIRMHVFTLKTNLFSWSHFDSHRWWNQCGRQLNTHFLSFARICAYSRILHFTMLSRSFYTGFVLSFFSGFGNDRILLLKWFSKITELLRNMLS